MTERTGPRRTWIKLYCYQRLHGSMAYDLEEAEQSVWDKLLCMAGLCAFEGAICNNDGKPFPHSFIAHELHTSEELLETTLSKCKEEGRITEDETGIHITNWTAYQSEYARQKPYRKKKKAEPEPEPIKDPSLKDDIVDAKLAKKVSYFESNIGMLSPSLFERLKDIADTYPEGWFEKAVDEAAAYGKRNLKYIEAILERWQAEGISTTKPETPPAEEGTVEEMKVEE